MTTSTEAPVFSEIKDPKERVRQMHDAFVAAVQAIQTDADWTAWLDMGSKFYKYSFMNLLLIISQRPDASLVGGAKNCWSNKFERHIRKGERAIWINAPVFRRATEDELAADPTRKQIMCGFRAVPVYDVAQTDGKPLPETPARPALLEGEAPFAPFATLRQMVINRGYTFEYADNLGGANGLTIFTTKRVLLRRGMSQAQTFKTLVHEVAHVLLHGPETVCRDDAEVEAESVAYLVLKHHGVDAGAYSFGYVAGWAGRDVEAVQRTGERVMRLAKSLIEATDPTDMAS